MKLHRVLGLAFGLALLAPTAYADPPQATAAKAGLRVSERRA